MDLYISIIANDRHEAANKLKLGMLELGVDLTLLNIEDETINDLPNWYFSLNDNYIDFLGNIDGKWLINIRSFSIDIDVDTYISPIDGFKLNTPQIPFRVFA